MARKRRGGRRDRRHRRRGAPLDLEPYEGCPADAELGLDPLAVGWIQRNDEFTTGATPEGFAGALLEFCREPHTVCAVRHRRPCPICGEQIAVTVGGQTVDLGGAEVRVLGDEEIFAAPDLIYHYVAEHGYRPPPLFVQAVLQGPQPGTPEHRVLVRTLNRQ